ncbi:MAG: ABC transporter ATP-binding protein [Proteobacteria bacterium]|nr:MAG: ABC transporter ATP-binding protein [Pseudomonadota bacterium]
MSAAAPDLAVELCGVHKAFHGKPVLRGVDLAIARGETFTILGGSGSGKSVCLKHVIGLLRPDRGRIAVLGTDVGRLRETEWVAIRRRCGMVFQGAALFDSLSVHENVAYPLRQHQDLPEPRVRARVAECLEAVGLPGVEAMLPAELSGGMRKRVGVARAIALEPELVLYDEPTTGLDPANARRIAELIAELNRRLHVTSVVVTHDLDLCFAVSDRLGLLKGGRIAACGSVDEMRASEHPDVRAFFEGVQDVDDGGEPNGEDLAHGT